jgi:glucose-6-phosphate isomerase
MIDTATDTALRGHADRLRATTLGALFADDPGRAAALTVSVDDLTIDFSKEKLDAAARDALLALAPVVAAARDAMAAGALINNTEGRPALHMALRGTVAPDVEGVSAVASVRDAFLAFAEDVRGGVYRPSGQPITDVVNIGIGGSDLGPAMVVRALAADADGPRVHCLSNVDGAHAADILRDLNPATTLAIVASKTFTTVETMTNARTVAAWLEAGLGGPAGAHLAAVSTNLEGCAAFGIPPDRVFGFWDWVGGRYSLWGAIGLPIAMAVGRAGFEALLAGAAAMDRHFLTAPPAQNLPMLLGLVALWRRRYLGLPSVALIPYDQRLERFPAYVQQLDMESLGKRVTREGGPVDGPTGALIWGEPGTNAQHSFFQLLHQGTDVVPVDFILAAEAREGPGTHHTQLVANCLAQSAALAFGLSEDAVRAEMAAAGKPQAEIDRLAAHRTFPGDRPSTTILHRRLDPFTLGRLVALYEHKVFTQAAAMGINPFDQWGVELGKVLAKSLAPAVESGDVTDFDGSTTALLARIVSLRDG